MLKYTPLLFAILLAFSAQAQLSEGFEKLDDQAFDEALVLFQEALKTEQEKTPAQWGIAQILANPDYAGHLYDSAYVLKGVVEAGLRKNKDSKAKKKWSKKYDLNPEALKALGKPLVDLQWKTLDGKKDIMGFDNFERIFKNRIPAKTKKEFEKQHNALRRYAVNGGAKTYKEVDYVLYKHSKYISDSFPGRLMPLQKSLFPLFMDEKGGAVLAIDSFFQKQPKHSVSNDAARADFSQALKTDKAIQWLKFVNKYPESPYDTYVSKHIEGLLAKQPLAEAEKNELNESEKWLLEDIQQGTKSGFRVHSNAIFDGKGAEQWLSYIQRRGGKTEGFNALKSMLKYYMNQRNWSAAEQLLKTQGALFPDNANWITSMTNMVAGPDNGIRPEALKGNVNTTGDEYSPTISYDGNTLSFCGASRKESIWGEDVYFSERKGEEWQNTKLSRDISGSGHEAPMCFTADGNTMVFFKNGKVFTSSRNLTGWGPANPFPVDLSAFGWVSDVHFVTGEQRVFFAAREKGIEWDYPKTDIYMAAKNENDEWGKPEKMGTPLNTDWSDRAPFIHPDQTTMYFSSAREGGFGDLDVYKTVRLDDTWKNWSEPINLGKNINTTGNNWGYVVTTDGSTAYYSAKVEGRSDEDIYSITLPQEARPQKQVQPVMVLVQDINKKPIPNSKVEVRSSKTGTAVGSYRTSPKDGKVTVYIPQDERFTISAIQTGFYGDPVSIDSRDEGKTIEITLKPIKGMIENKEKSALNTDILFDLGKSELKPEAAGQLKFVAEFVKREKLAMSLSGHTDPSGTDEDNMALSKARAEAVRDALIAAGVKPEKITADGFGETRLICTENTPDCHQRNRRVEIIWKD